MISKKWKPLRTVQYDSQHKKKTQRTAPCAFRNRKTSPGNKGWHWKGWLVNKEQPVKQSRQNTDYCATQNQSTALSGSVMAGPVGIEHLYFIFPIVDENLPAYETNRSREVSTTLGPVSISEHQVKRSANITIVLVLRTTINIPILSIYTDYYYW